MHIAAHIIIGAVATNDVWVKVLLVIRENIRHLSGICQTQSGNSQIGHASFTNSQIQFPATYPAP